MKEKIIGKRLSLLSIIFISPGVHAQMSRINLRHQQLPRQKIKSVA